MNNSPRTRLALITCKDDCITPWTFCNGEEVGVQARAIGDDEVISIIYQEASGKTHSLDIRAGYLAIPGMDSWVRYRVCKSKAIGKFPTIVEIVLK